METITTRHTYADYMSLPEGEPYQLIAGELVKEPSPTSAHQRIQSRLGTRLINFIEAGGLGEVYYAPMDVRFADDEVYQPDILFVAGDRLHIVETRHINGAPDLVVEILSPSTAYYDLRHKRQVYERSGVKEYWIIDPIELSIEVYANADGGFMMAAEATGKGLVASALLPGFALEAVDLFAR